MAPPNGKLYVAQAKWGTLRVNGGGAGVFTRTTEEEKCNVSHISNSIINCRNRKGVTVLNQR
jgi:hypothetical protein